MKVIDLTNKKFGRLTVIGYSGLAIDRQAQWSVRCECGKEFVTRSRNLREGTTKSCGCLRDELRFTHGMSKSSEFGIWKAMRGRCYRKSNRWYHNYGGRGIRVCKRWLEFENFLADMGLRPSKKHTIERINNEEDYKPDNCRWATRTEQMQNTRRNSLSKELVARICHFRDEGFSIAEISRILEKPYSTVRYAYQGKSWKRENL